MKNLIISKLREAGIEPTGMNESLVGIIEDAVNTVAKFSWEYWLDTTCTGSKIKQIVKELSTPGPKEEKKTYNLSKIMRTAHAIKNECADFSEALTKAWAAYKLAQQMREQEVQFTYIKSDGTTRSAKGTLKADAIPTPKGTGKKVSHSVVTYFDLDKNQYRSFNAARLAA